MDNATQAFRPLQADDPPQVAGYRLAARLGAGGMGRVYLSHTQGGRPVAIKVVRPELADDPAFRGRFRREIKAAQRVRGAYTAELIDADADGVPPWLATLYVPGPSLAEAVTRRGPLPVPAVLWLMAGVAEALQAIHGAGIVHRDLKPSNVLLASDGPRVIDFGISLTSGITSHTATGVSVGTPQFMAPEQASVGELTAATDVFALGQIVAFAALGRPLYGDGPSVSVLYRIVHSKPDLSLLPARLRPLMARCLAADPEERATPAEIVGWCRQELGQDAEAGAGPAVWQEVTEPEAGVPFPVPHPTQVHTQVHSQPLLAQPQPGWPQSGWPQPGMPDGRPGRRRHTALITAAVTAGALLLTGVAWAVGDAANRLRHRDAAVSSTSGPGSGQSSGSRSGQSSGSRSGQSSGSARSSETSSSSEQHPGAGGRGPEAPRSPSTAVKEPKALAYPFQMLTDTNSLSIKEPVERQDRKGDIRFVCKEVGCTLESNTSVLSLLSGKAGASLDSCRRDLKGADSHQLFLYKAAVGSEICVKHPTGDIALLVLQTKSTAMPKIGFLIADLTVWRAAR